MRVAAAQFAVGVSVDQNLATCLRMIESAVADCQPALLVLPEFCNHLSWYEGRNHCDSVAVEENGPFLSALCAAAQRHRIHLVVNCTLRRGPEVTTGTSFLIDPEGEIIAEADKQVLMGHENDFLQSAVDVAPIRDTPVGRLGLYACMDGVINETPRSLALRGADILCNSLNSFALDEGSLHVPVRAAENRSFVVAANKIGPLIPEPALEPVAAATGIPAEYLHGAGESQIVAPDGKVLAKASRDQEEVIWADIEVQQARTKLRPDGTHIFESRRPELYGAIGRTPVSRGEPPRSLPPAGVAVIQPEGVGDAAVAHVIAALAELSGEIKLVVLPELFDLPDALVGHLDEARRRGAATVAALKSAAREGLWIATSIVEGDQHVGVLITARGIVHRQPQLHRTARHAGWMVPGERAEVIDLPWARFALVVGDDALFPETFRLLAVRGVEVVAAPVHVLETWEVATGLRERSAENRMCLIAATRPSDAGTSRIYDLHEDFTLMTPWKSRPFDGTISDPLVTAAPDEAGTTVGTVTPAATHNKVVSRGTDLVDGRPWPLVDAITGGL